MWERELAGRLSQAEATINRTAGRLRPPTNAHDLTRAVQLGHPHWLIDERRRLRVALVACGGAPVTERLVEEVRRFCAAFPGVEMCDGRGGPRIHRRAEGGKRDPGALDSLVIQGRRDLHCDLVVVVTDGSWGWPTGPGGEVTLAVGKDVGIPLGWGQDVIRVGGRDGVVETDRGL
jgi:hypothetical protein